MSKEKPAKGGRRKLRIDKYEVIEHIATGGMGAVYKARDSDLGREVALKVLSPDMASKPGALERFRAEAQHAAKLRHENIVAIYEIGEANGTWFLALEFVEGIDLYAHIEQKGKLEPVEARYFLVQAAKALEQVHKAGLVHRDVKPSNFLITRKDNRALIKLTDLGLAREVRDEDFKVTRAGTTVGTVDYMSPEQARDSRAADIRSDIYSLGCTFYHMLTGQPPFAVGGLTERLYKHIHDDPEDVCRLNPKVPEAMAAVLRRMMEKQPSNRYQTPTELLRDLDRLRPGGGAEFSQRDFLAALALDDPSAQSSQSRRTAPGTEGAQPTATGIRRLRRDDKRKRLLVGQDLVGDRPWWPYAALVGGVLVVVLIAVVIAMQQSGQSGHFEYKADAAPIVAARETQPPVTVRPRGSSDDPIEPEAVEPPPPRKEKSTSKKASRAKSEPTKPETVARAAPNATTTAPVERPTELLAPARSSLPKLYQPAETIVGADVEKAFQAPWSGTPTLRTAGNAAMRVSRLARPGPGTHYESLAAACAAAPAGKETIIEIHDSGPLYEPAIAVEGRSLVIRAAPGFRPLLAWDLGLSASGTTPEAFLSLTGGNLHLQNVEIVARAAETPSGGPAQLLRVSAGECEAWGCTFSVAQRRPEGIAVLQLSHDKTGTPAKTKARFNHCFLRGLDMVGLDLRAPGAEVLFEDCLLVGTTQPLFEVRGRDANPTVLRLARTTCVARQTFLRVRPDTASDVNPAVQFHGLDMLVSRSGADGSGCLLVLERCTRTNIQWKPVNCLYTGWPLLLTASDNQVAATSLDVWHTLWGHKEGDRTLTSTWPAVIPSDPGEVAKEQFRTAGSPVQFAAISGDNALGCEIGQLPACRDTWVSLLFDRYLPPAADLPAGGPTPEIPTALDEAYAGERLDLVAGKIDLGEHLQRIQKARPLAPRVVLHLGGSGRAATSPIRLKGSTLVLCFETPATEPGALELLAKDAHDVEALIDIENGGLEITNGSIRFLNQKWAAVPRLMFKVRGGDVRLYGCRLTGPLGGVPDNYRGLIAFQGSGRTEADRSQECQIVDSVLASAKCCLHSAGVGARLRLRNNVLVAGGDAIHLDPGPAPDKWRALAALLPSWCPAFDPLFRLPPRARLNAQCLLENNTIAARGTAILLSDGPDLAVPLSDPFIVKAKNNVFEDAFRGTTRQSGLIASEGGALGRGLLVWQGDANVYDKGLRYGLASTSQLPETPQSYAAWSRSWGSGGDRQALHLDRATSERKLDLNAPKLEQFMLPASFRAKSKGASLGSDLIKLC